MDAVQWSGKNQQQNANAALRQVKTWAELLNTFCTNAKLELELIYKVQIQCYEDAKLMKLFPEIIRSLYDQDVLAEDTILHWFRKGTNPKGRYINTDRTLLHLHIINSFLSFCEADFT
ncbi:hypothetical protein QQ045_022173 [Rhodiola kirilowii]